MGGYDQARFQPSDLTFANGGDQNSTLPVKIHSIIAENLSTGTASLLPNGVPVTATIDSTVSQLYLPQGVCDLFQSVFGLEYDQTKDFYLVNNTAHGRLLQSNPSVTFTIGDNSDSSSTTNIRLPYAAFDLAVGIPFYNNDTRYFPIRAAKDESQQVLGRSFLQEAYVVVDWERNNFTIGQAIHQRESTNIMEIASPATELQPPSADLGTGAMVGIVIGAVVGGLAITITAIIFMRTRRRKKDTVAAYISEYPPDHKNASELDVEHSNLSEVYGSQIYELNGGSQDKHELPVGLQISELHGNVSKTEMEDTSCRYAPSDRSERRVHEMP